MAQGEAFAKARVTINGTKLDGVFRAVIENGVGIITDREGNVVKTLQGPIDVSGYSGNSAWWQANGEQWFIKKFGCSCNGDEP